MTRANPPADIGRNAGLNFLGQVLPMLVAVVSMPYLVRLLGTERVGLLSLVLLLVGYFSLLDFGMSRAVTQAVARALGAADRDKVPSVFWSAATFQVLMGVLGCLLLALGAPLLIGKILRVPGHLAGEAYLSLLLSAFSLPLVLFSTSLVGLLQAAQRFDLTNAVQVPVSIANYLLPLLCALWWPSLPVVVAILVLTRCASTLLLLNLAGREFPGLTRQRSFRREEFKFLFSFGGWVTVSAVVNPILVYADRFLIGALLSLSAVAYYSVPSDTVVRLGIFPASLVTALFPVFSKLGTTDGRFSVDSLVSRSLRFLVCFLGLPVILMVVFAGDIMRLWMGPEFAVHSALPLRIMAVGIFFNGLAFVPHSLIQGTGRPDITAKLSLIELPLHIVLLTSFVLWWGLPGAALAWSIRYAVDSLLMFALACRVTPLTTRSLTMEKMPVKTLSLVLLGIVTAAVAAVCDGMAARSLLFIGVTIAGIGLLWLVVLTADDRATVLRSLSTSTNTIV